VNRASDTTPGDSASRILLGSVNGVFGVKGWIKVFSETDPRQNIVRYRQWQLRTESGNDDHWRTVKVLDGRVNGKNVIAKLDGVDDIESAEKLRGCLIAIDRADLPDLEPGEYYWKDLVGLTVTDVDGTVLGVVSRLFETGANDVMVLDTGEKEVLVPWVKGDVVKSVVIDGHASGIVVEWDIDWDTDREKGQDIDGTS